MLLWVNRGVFSPTVFLQVLLTLFPCYLSIWLFCYVLLILISCSKIVLFPCHLVVGMSSCILSLLACRILLHCFGISCFVYIVLRCLNIFLIFLLSPVPSGLFPPVVLLVLLVLLYLFCSSMFQCSSSVLSFLLVVVDFLSAFPAEFSIQILNFRSCS